MTSRFGGGHIQFGIVLRVIAGIAGVSAITGVVIMTLVMARPAQEPEALVTSKQVFTVIKTVRAGERIRPGDIIEIHRSSDKVPDDALTERREAETGTAAVNLLPGDILSRSSLQAELGDDLVQPDAKMRVISIPVDGLGTVGGFITPWSRVDVLYTVPTVNDSVTMLLLEDVRIVSVDGQSAIGQRAANGQGALIVGLEVHPDDTAKLSAITQNNFPFSLLLRGKEQSTVPDTVQKKNPGLGVEATIQKTSAPESPVMVSTSGLIEKTLKAVETTEAEKSNT